MEGGGSLRYTIFSGCLVQARFPEYEKSARLVMDHLGVEFKFIDKFSCCGSQILESIDKEKLLLLNGRNIALAEQNKIDTIITICGSCTYILKRMNLELQDGPKKQKINDQLSIIGLSLKNSLQIKHLAEFLNEGPIFKKLQSEFKKKLPLKLAFQNPCMLYRPKRISQIDKTEKTLISRLLQASGAEIIPYKFQDQCCEGTMLAFNKRIGEPLVRIRYESINKLNADLFVVGCPNCQLVYSMFPSSFYTDIIPSIFFPQILGLALGHSFTEIGLNRNREYKKVINILESKGIR
ncbi:MAG: heterodisulfide reductase-related iron-sulfur binding cluster [Candidatus Helarchaeota archaeon]